MITHTERHIEAVAIPIKAGMIRLSDLRDLVEATSEHPEEHFAHVYADELRVVIER